MLKDQPFPKDWKKGGLDPAKLDKMRKMYRDRRPKGYHDFSDVDGPMPYKDSQFESIFGTELEASRWAEICTNPYTTKVHLDYIKRILLQLGYVMLVPERPARGPLTITLNYGEGEKVFHISPGQNNGLHNFDNPRSYVQMMRWATDCYDEAIKCQK